MFGGDSVNGEIANSQSPPLHKSNSDKTEKLAETKSWNLRN